MQECNSSSGARRRRLQAAWLGVWLVLLAVAPGGSRVQAQTITLSGTTTTAPFREYATRELADPWDMSQRTDLGWFTWSADSPPSNQTSLAIATDARGNTYFTSRASGGAPWFFLLDTWTPGAARLGKLGVNHPIDTTIYNTLYFKMKIANDMLALGEVAQVVWSRDTIYGPPVSSNDGGQILVQNAAGAQVGPYLTPQLAQPFTSLEGGSWVIYRIPLVLAQMKLLNADIDHWQNVNGGNTSNWGNAGVTADSLRVSPFQISTGVGEIQIDWARLVSSSPGNAMSITWSPSGTYDIVVSAQPDCSDFAVIAYSQSSGYQFQTQVLPPGTYRVGLRLPFKSTGHTAPSGSTLASCSTGTFTVQSYPSLTMTSPNAEGSADDFATSQLGDAWDFDALSDFDFGVNVNLPDPSYGIVTKAATDPAGNDLGSVRVFRNLSTAVSSGVGDPYIYPMWPTPEQAGARFRGLSHRIDTSRYRILTAELGIERTRDLTLGSIARILWHVDGEKKLSGNLAEIESSDIALRHLDPATQNGGRIVLDTIQADMADRWSLPVETDYAQPGSGWNNTCTANPGTTTCDTSSAAYRPGVDLFRLDFHEFSAATPSYVRRIKLAAIERTGSSFQIQWAASNPSSLAATVTLKAVPVMSPASGNYRPIDPACSTGGSITIATGVALAGGAYTWNPGTTGVTNGAEYFVCAQIVVGGNVVDEELSRWPVIIDTAYAGPKPLMRLDRSTLHLTGVRNGLPSPVLSYKTPPETVRFAQDGSGTVNWSVTVKDRNGLPVSWLSVSNTSGTGPGSFTVSLNDDPTLPTCTPVDGLLAIVSLTSPDLGNSPQPVQVNATIYSGAGGAGGCTTTSGSTAAPLGMVDTPVQNAAGVVGSIGVTGWAVDDVGINSVKLYRNCLAFEPTANCNLIGGLNLVYMGDADIVPGARPDVEAVYPSYPQAYRAGWGYLLLTNMLPHIPREVMFGGQGSLSIYVFATDVEGHLKLLGRSTSDQTPTTITMANDTAVKPFGAIDTPGQGQIVTGPMWNFGWALTPDINETADAGDIVVPIGGTTMWVWIDGAPVSRVTYNLCRGTVGSPVPGGSYCDDDVASIFGNPTPQPFFTPRIANPTKYRNLDAGRGAMGAYYLDTTALSNGRHSIVWGVTDSMGRVDGIGSRDFIVFNGGTSLTALAEAAVRPLGDAAAVAALPLGHDTVWGRTTFDLKAPWQVVEPGPTGTRHVRIPEFGRLELYLGPATRTGYLVANGTLRPLPPGSQMRAGDFTWAPGVGYSGEYDLVFVNDAGQVPVSVTIFPAGERFRIDAYLEQPRPNATVSGPFTIAGWAADRTAWHGTGIGAVHVWAFSRTSAAETSRRPRLAAEPVFLGAATVGGIRPDVGLALGAQFEKSGWALSSRPLDPGTYDVVAYFWSSITGRFEDARVVTVIVR